MTIQAQKQDKGRVCRFDLLKISDKGIKPVCRDLNSQQLVDLLEEMKAFGTYIAKFTGWIPA